MRFQCEPFYLSISPVCVYVYTLAYKCKVLVLRIYMALLGCYLLTFCSGKIYGEM